MKALPTILRDVLLLEPQIFGDDRGFFLESYNRRTFAELGVHDEFVQDNHSFSVQNTLRGLHYQVRQPQGKLVRTIIGAILDVAVDLRRSSATFGQVETFLLSGENKRMVWIPAGFAHGFRVVSETAHVAYKTSGFYSLSDERTIAWDDPDLRIKWDLSGPPILSRKDQQGRRFRDAEVFD
jgi:dTDP-4-dehydrorhamnose 3,5-epimerase